jgi:hypothetical protein
MMHEFLLEVIGEEHGEIKPTRLSIVKKIKVYELFERESFETNMDLCNFIESIIKQSKGEIENQTVVKNLINYQFETTKKVAKFIGALFVLGHMIPFYIQLYSDRSDVIKTCTCLSVLVQAFFLFQEAIQLKDSGMSYFKEPLNYLDVSMILVTIDYALMRFNQEKRLLPIHEDTPIRDILTSLLISILIFLKTMSLLRASTVFSKMVLLITKVFVDLIPFTAVLIATYIQSSLMYDIIGAKIYDTESDFKDENLSDFTKQMFQSFRNSVGDITLPVVAITKHGEFLQKLAYGQFTVWQFFLMIILLNFLIAKVG